MATWARGVDFKNSTNTTRVGGIGIYGTDATTNKLYIGLGTEPWNNAGLQLTSSAINFKGNKIYHAGDKPTLSELGAGASSHTHSYLPLTGGCLTGNIAFTKDNIGMNFYDGAKIYKKSGSGLTIVPHQDSIGLTVTNASETGNIFNVCSNSITYKGNKIYHAGDKPTLSELGAAASNHNHNGIYVNDKANVSGNMNNAAGYRNALGMINLSGTDATINPNGQTGWHHFINMSYSESSGSNMWQTQIANKAGTTDLWVRSRAGSEITDGTAWAAPWTRILTGSNYKSIVTPANIGAAPTSTGGNITLHADSDSSSTAEYVLIKAGHNELKVASSAGGSTVTKGADKLTFNGSVVYHAGYKPSKSDVGLGSVNNWGASSDVAANSTSQYATTNMVAKVRAEKANISHTHNYAAASHTHGLLHDTMIVEIPSTTTDNGWSMLNSSYNGFLLKSIRTNANAPSWILGNYSAGIVFGGADTKGVLSMSYNGPSIKFAGGNGTKPVWNMALTGSSGKTYNMESLSANTANTLATARTINGTSFNGSANITTANWGTARTITVGSTAKSVNGSANIGWTLAEIGAVPSYTGGSTTIHADSDASSTSEYLLLKAGHNELKIASSAGGTTVTKGQDKLTFNGNIVYHAGRKPSYGELGFGSIPTHAPLVTNLNSQLQSGWYSLNTSTSGRPSGVDYGVVLQIRWFNGADFYQICISSGNARVYTRGYINGGYTGWNEK